MDEEYNLISAKLLEFELQGTITPDQKATLASAISRILHQALAKRDALKVTKIQAMEGRLNKIKLFFDVPHFDTSDQTYKLKDSDKPKRKVFIVHGRNGEMKHATARVIEKLGLEAIILSEKPNLSRTLIEKFIDNSEVNYALVLLSPDDMGYLKEEGNETARPRARQNVIFELGFFLGKIQRDNVAVMYLVTPDFDIPSDFLGGTYIPYDENEGWKFRLVEELKARGFDVDANKLLGIH